MIADTITALAIYCAVAAITAATFSYWWL